MSRSIEEALVGEYIISFEMDGLGEWVKFNLKGKDPVILDAEGDCCSQSWIESVDAPLALRGKVFGVEEIEMPNLGDMSTPKHDNPDFVRYYGLKIITENGHAVLDYRNDSNGYYGGWLDVR